MCSCVSVTDRLSSDLGDPVVRSKASSGYALEVNNTVTKYPENSNPIISNVFCADPTSIEYNGRIYIYGSCDQQQFDVVGADGENTYEHIKSLVVLSTDDMVNYTYHGTIDVGSICPWIIASWAPSIVSREESDGLTHFYLYFANSGAGTGVITATSPLGSWSDPLGKALVDKRTKGLMGCSVPFDPGACIDDSGTGWLTFGGLGNQCARIVRLGSDMISFDSDIKKIPAPCHFEANELNFINGTYVYTYNTNWEDHSAGWDIEGVQPPPVCSMCYMTTKTPLEPDSWVYHDYYFKNPGEQGLEYGNNHTHLQKFNDRYYLFYHSMFPQKNFGTSGGFRSISVDEAEVDEKNLVYSEVKGTKEGVSQIKNFDPGLPVNAATSAACSGISYIQGENGVTVHSGSGDGKASWICVRGADFGNGKSNFAARVKGTGVMEVRKGSISGDKIAELNIDCDDFCTFYDKTAEGVSGVFDLYFVISDGIDLESWQFI